MSPVICISHIEPGHSASHLPVSDQCHVWSPSTTASNSDHPANEARWIWMWSARAGIGTDGERLCRVRAACASCARLCVPLPLSGGVRLERVTLLSTRSSHISFMSSGSCKSPVFSLFLKSVLGCVLGCKVGITISNASANHLTLNSGRL